ncbi:hypothetical protein D3C81_1818880 [compost metagenome]
MRTHGKMCRQQHEANTYPPENPAAQQSFFIIRMPGQRHQYGLGHSEIERRIEQGGHPGAKEAVIRRKEQKTFCTGHAQRIKNNN